MWFLPDITKKIITKEEQVEIIRKECLAFNMRQLRKSSNGLITWPNNFCPILYGIYND